MRIAFAVLAAGMMTGFPALAQDTAVAPKAVSSISVRTTKSGVMTLGDKSISVFRISGGDLIADVVPAKAGQPMHLGPTRYDPLYVSIDADGLMALKAETAALLAGQPPLFNAEITYNGRKLVLINARIVGTFLPSCNQGKPGSELMNLTIRFDKVIVTEAAEPTQVKPAALSGCSVTAAGLPANAIRAATPGPSFALPVKETGVGEMRVYEDTDPDDDLPTTRNITLTENAAAPGLTDWARNDLQKGIGENRPLQITYATAAGPAVQVSFGKTLARRVTLDLNAAARVTLATENPSITKP